MIIVCKLEALRKKKKRLEFENQTKKTRKEKNNIKYQHLVFGNTITLSQKY